MRVVLVTQFQRRFLEQDTLPALRKRGVEVVEQWDPRRLPPFLTFELMKAKGVEMILVMTEVGGHSDAEVLARQARTAGLQLRALSRKKASWSFLPPPAPTPPPPTIPTRPPPPPPAPTAPRRTIVALPPMKGPRPVVALPVAAPLSHRMTIPLPLPAEDAMSTPDPDTMKTIRAMQDRIDDLEKLHNAKRAFDVLVQLGYLTPLEAAERLFRGAKA